MEFDGSFLESVDREDYVDDGGKRGAWRPIHYLGSKLRALPALEEAIATVAPQGAPICDLFAGSGTVAAWLADTRPVAAVDIQEYSRVICDALLNPSHLSAPGILEELAPRIATAAREGVIFAAEALIEHETVALAQAHRGRPLALASLIEAGSLATSQTDDIQGELARASRACRSRLTRLRSPAAGITMLRQFGGTYFSYRQAAELDVILDYAHTCSTQHRSTLIAAALSTASELVNTVGKHFAQPLRPRNKDGTIKRGLANQASRDRGKSALDVFGHMLTKYLKLPRPKYASSAFRADYADFLAAQNFQTSVVYADPPYTRDHYSRFYHVLETMALRDNPQISTNTAHGRTAFSRGAYRKDRHQSPFCIKSEAPSAFEMLFAGVAHRRVPLVLSYSPYASEKNAHPRVMTIETVTKLAREHFKSVDISSIGTFFHSRLNRSDLNKEISYEAECLVICRP